MGSQNNEGLIPRLCNFLFELIAEKTCPSWQAKVEVSYMEIYNEKIYDLLDPMTSSSNSKQSLKVCSLPMIPREGVIIECTLNGQFHDRRDVIITSRMAVNNNFITVTVNQNIGNSSK